MNPTARIRIGLEDRRTQVFLKILAVLFFLGAASHFAGIVGLAGGSWTAKPIWVRIADPVMLLFNLIVGWGLWRGRFWAVVSWIVGVLILQVIPITLFIDFFATNAVQRQTLWGLLAIHAVVIGIFLLLLRKRE